MILGRPSAGHEAGHSAAVGQLQMASILPGQPQLEAAGTEVGDEWMIEDAM